MKIKRLIERWSAVKALLEYDEYFLGVSKPKDDNSSVIYYDYIKNTDRDMFYKFIGDYINKIIKKNED